MSEIDKAVDILNNGGVVGIPTETVYGLAGSINSDSGIQAIFSTKERPFFDPLIVHVNNTEQAKAYISSFPSYFDKLAKKLWPGPVTFILPKSHLVSDIITSGLDTVGLRCPSHPVAQQLITKLGHPVAAPSANKFKKTSPTSYTHVKNEFPEIFVLEGGECEVGIESTILGLEKSSIKIYRPGMLSRDSLSKILKELDLESIDIEYEESPVAPGHLKHHYMPNKKVILFKQDHSIEVPKELLSSPQVWELPNNPVKAARELYGKFRELDKLDPSSIMIKLNDNQLRSDEFRGIINRLQKAATFSFI